MSGRSSGRELGSEVHFRDGRVMHTPPPPILALPCVTSTNPDGTINRTFDASKTTFANEARNTTLVPPASLLPPPLDLPDRAPTDSAPVYYFRLGKAYLTFYKTALRAVYHNRLKLAWSLAKVVPLAELPFPVPVHTRNWLNMYEDGIVNRAEFHLLDRAYRDGRRAPLLLLLLLVCGEFTPLVVAGVPWAVPGVCKLPAQEEKRRQKLEARRKASWATFLAEREGEGAWDPRGGGAWPRSVHELTPAQMRHVARSLGLYLQAWDTLFGAPPRWWYRWKCRKWYRYLVVDDVGLLRGGAPLGMPLEEVRRACEIRGIDVLGRGEPELRGRLVRWLEEGETYGPMALLTRKPGGALPKEPRKIEEIEEVVGEKPAS